MKNFDYNTPSTTVFNNKPFDKKEIVKTRNVPKQILISNWSQDQVLKHFKSKKVNDKIMKYLLPCDGRLLEQLYITLKEVTEFFHSILRSDSRASLNGIVLFTAEFSQPFKKF